MAGISAILLAAGESTRMGGQLKALLPWQGKTLLQYQIGSIVEAGAAEVVVVLGHQASSLAPYVRGPRVKSVINTHYRSGKTTSIKAGLKGIDRQAEGVLLLAVDQPRPVEAIARLLAEHRSRNALITAPRYQGRGGHPVLFSTALMPELERISEDKLGIREVMEAYRREVHWVEVDTPIVRLDINDPEEYERAKRLLRA